MPVDNWSRGGVTAAEILLASHLGTSRIVVGELGPGTRSGRPPRRVLMVVDRAVPADFVATVRTWLRGWNARVDEHRVEGGEPLKEIAGWSDILAAFDRCRLDRESCAVAVGGGTVGDAVGFAAATWQRGIDWIAFPTTVIAMVDAHIGGKTGINFGGVKNSVGAFHLPRDVFVDLRALAGLPRRDVRSGWGEIVKTVILGAPDLFRAFERGECARGGTLPPVEVVRSCIEIKTRIVADDPGDMGARRQLNLGHTVGHAIEARLGFGPLSHGEAVAIGMAFAARLAADRGHASDGVVRRIETVLESFALPIRWDPALADDLMSLVSRDKKVSGSSVTMALPCDIGDVRLVPVPLTAIHRLLQTGA